MEHSFYCAYRRKRDEFLEFFMFIARYKTLILYLSTVRKRICSQRWEYDWSWQGIRRLYRLR